MYTNKNMYEARPCRRAGPKIARTKPVRNPYGIRTNPGITRTKTVQKPYKTVTDPYQATGTYAQHFVRTEETQDPTIKEVQERSMCECVYM